MKHSLVSSFLIFSLSAGIFLPSASATSFRCNSYVIDVGMHKTEVLKKCGLPSSYDTRLERRIVRSRQAPLPSQRELSRQVFIAGQIEFERDIEIVTEEWVYNFGPHQLMQLLVFEEGRLKVIRDLEYGN